MILLVNLIERNNKNVALIQIKGDKILHMRVRHKF